MCWPLQFTQVMNWGAVGAASADRRVVSPAIPVGVSIGISPDRTAVSPDTADKTVVGAPSLPPHWGE